jgi:hypothetical protein
LSEQITSTDHNVSTEESLLIRAFLVTIRLTQRASEIVTTAGSHSGMAATASATAVKKATISDS